MVKLHANDRADKMFIIAGRAVNSYSALIDWLTVESANKSMREWVESANKSMREWDETHQFVDRQG